MILFLVNNVITTKVQTQEQTWWIFLTSYIVLRLSECLNPIFYNLGSRLVLLMLEKGLKKFQYFWEVILKTNLFV